MAGKQQSISREYFSVKELSAYTGVCERTLRDMLNASTNPIPHYRFGGSIKIKRSEFDDWAAKHCRIEKDDRLDRLVDELAADLGVSTKRNRKPAAKSGRA